MRLLGTIPSPIIGGKLIDKTCIAWQESCGKRGNCRLYDRDMLSKTILGVYLVYKEPVHAMKSVSHNLPFRLENFKISACLNGTKTLGLVCWIVAIVSYKPDMDYGDPNAVAPAEPQNQEKPAEVQGEANETAQ